MPVLSKAGIAKIVIERTLKLVTVTIHTARPGIIIGKGGQEVDKLKEELKKITKKEIQINISEIKRPELDAVIVASTSCKPDRRTDLLPQGDQDFHCIGHANRRGRNQDADLRTVGWC